MRKFNSKYRVQKYRNIYYLPGFTIAELLVTMAIFVTLVGIATINLVGAKQRASLNTSIDILLGDLRSQQLKSMIGDTEGRVAPGLYGIHFGSYDYTLFHGNNFDINAPSNFTVKLGDNVQFINPPSDLIFARVSGELANGGSILLRDNTTNTTRTLQYNRYGVVTNVY